MIVARADRANRRGRRRRGDGGFTMIEVMVAMLIALVGLLGTVAVQQAVLSATANANDASVALRLASQAMEELNTRVAAPGEAPAFRMGAANGQWSAPVHVDVRGAPAAGPSGAARWVRRIRIADLGANQPYNLSVEISYALDSGTPKVVRMDMERRK